ncbi:hypothetical protein KAS45_06720, partial [candidate division WOR-3 bacterium]|nr:hypothetical protein [candidate division WOR-3 bacterium]
MKCHEIVSIVGIAIILFSITSIAFAEERMLSENREVRIHEAVAEISRDGEFLIDTGIIDVPVPVGQVSPAIAFDGTNYLVVWQDERSESDYYYDIYGARVDQVGNILDPTGIAICTATNDQALPVVAFDGTNYLVVWEDERSFSPACDIYGARVSISGAVLDPAGIAIAVDYMADQLHPAVAFDGVNFFVVWRDQRSGAGDIYGARVSQSGTVLDPTGILITPNANYQNNPDIAFDGTNYLVVWSDYRNGVDYDIYGARVTQAGTVVDPGGFTISTSSSDQHSPEIAFDGTSYLVVWEDYRNGVDCDIYGARVTQSGNVLDTSGIAISTVATDQEVPSVAFDNTNFLVVWHDSRSDPSDDIYGARISQAGAVLDTAGILISAAARDQTSPAITFGTSNYLAVWQDERNFSLACDIYGTRIEQSGNVLDTAGVVVSTVFTVVNEQYAPDVACDSNNYLVVWHDNRSVSSDICAARVNQSGSVLDSASIVVSSGSGMYNQEHPVVAFDGTNYLVVWEDGRGLGMSDIYGARIDPSGNVLDISGIAITTAYIFQGLPAVVFGGTYYFVVWQDHGGNYPPDIRGARVDQSGNVLDPAGIAISAAFSYQGAPSIAFDGSDYLIVWQDSRSGSFDIYGARVDQTGSVLDPNGIVISNATSSQQSPAVAFDGTNYLIVWQDERNGFDYDIYGARVDQAGNVLDSTGIAISTAINVQTTPAVAFDGTNYL